MVLYEGKAEQEKSRQDKTRHDQGWAPGSTKYVVKASTVESEKACAVKEYW